MNYVEDLEARRRKERRKKRQTRGFKTVQDGLEQWLSEDEENGTS
jgi:hypothetical protein